MNQQICREKFHEALSKAFSAKGDRVRMAYFDLASFYQRKLGDQAGIYPSNDDLCRCLAIGQSPD